MYIFSGSKVIAEYENGAAPSSPTREYIYAGGALLARVDSSGTNYYHQDHLSNRIVTNSSGSVVAEMGHFPYGESWYNATNDKLNFTTYEYDSESGNHYAMARRDVSRLGRLSSPDPPAGSTANPQSLNRYSYSINDPANVTDPSGASAGCTTVEVKPKDKSQPASSGGHSDTDSLGADADTGDADADPPPQSGCVDHTNPFGGGGDALSDWDAAFGIGGSGGLDGGYVGDDSGQLPNGGFQVGASGSASVSYALLYEQICGPQSNGGGSSLSTIVNGNCIDTITEIPMSAGPILNSLIGPTVTSARTAAAVQAALKALTIEDCASLFGNGVNPVELLKVLTSAGSGLGTISNSDLGASGTVAQTKGILGPMIATWGGVEHLGSTFSGANIVINNNLSAPFMAGWAGTTTATGVHLGGAYSDSDLNAGTQPRFMGTWLFLFDELYGEAFISAEENAEIVARLEYMLAKTSDRTPTNGVYENLDPWGAEAAARRLAKHYRRIKERNNEERVISALARHSNIWLAKQTRCWRRHGFSRS